MSARVGHSGTIKFYHFESWEAFGECEILYARTVLFINTKEKIKEQKFLFLRTKILQYLLIRGTECLVLILAVFCCSLHKHKHTLHTEQFEDMKNNVRKLQFKLIRSVHIIFQSGGRSTHNEIHRSNSFSLTWNGVLTRSRFRCTLNKQNTAHQIH